MKLLRIFLVGVLVFSFAGCGKSKKERKKHDEVVQPLNIEKGTAPDENDSDKE